MIRFLDALTFFMAVGYVFVFYTIMKLFLPMRKNLLMKIAALVVCNFLADMVIYSNDLENLLGTMVLFIVYVTVFYRGTFMEKFSVFLVFYPSMIAVNYLMQDIGSRIYFGLTHAGYWDTREDSHLLLLSTAIHTFSIFLRLLFWTGVWAVLRKFLSKITLHLTRRMWLIIDMVMMASFVAIFTIIYFMPEDTAIVYPICVASIFSSFSCMYLAYYIYDAMQNAYRAQEMERQKNYYKERIKDEERVRSVYHDLKNHLLILEDNQGTEDTRRMARELREQIAGYENYIHTGNEFLDVIIRDKGRAAREKKIDFYAAVHLEADSFLEPLDISTIFGNAIDNAIEASEKLPEEQRLVTAKADHIRDMLVITVENNILPEQAVPGGTTKRDSFLHGFGIPNIKNTVEKYGGECVVRAEKGTFLLKVVVPYPCT